MSTIVPLVVSAQRVAELPEPRGRTGDGYLCSSLRIRTISSIDFGRVRETLDEIDYSGWLIIEGATEQGRSTFDCYVDNRKFLRGIFPA